MTKRIISLLLPVFALMTSVTSCGLMDMELDKGETVISSLSLPYDSVYVMVGDTFDIQPIIEPLDSMGQSMMWTSRADSVLKAENNLFVALEEGESVITCMNVQTLISDTCLVTVLPRWQLNPRDYFESMVYYADVTVKGKPFDPETQMIVARFENNILGVGELREAFGVKYVELQVWFPTFIEPEFRDEYDNLEVRFSLYDRATLQLYTKDTAIKLDRETHGTLSNLYRIDF